MNLYIISIIIILLGAVFEIWYKSTDDSGLLKKYLGIIIIIIGAVILILKTYLDWKITEELANDGIVSGERNKNTETVSIYYGGNISIFPRNNSIKGQDFYIPITSGEGDKDFVFRISDSQFFVSGIVRGLNEEIVAEIQDNEWKLNPNNYFRRNYDKNSLEVIDNYGIPVLQVENFDNEKIRINGVFIKSKTLRIVTTNGLIKIPFNPLCELNENMFDLT